MDYHFLLQGISPTQRSNPGLLHCRQVLYHLNHQGSPLKSSQTEFIILEADFPSWAGLPSGHQGDTEAVGCKDEASGHTRFSRSG